MPLLGIIRYRVVLKYMGGVLLILGGAFLLTAVVSAAVQERIFFYYIFFSILSTLLGLYLFKRVPEREVTTPEAAAIGSLSFLVASLVCALPFLLLNGAGPVDAWFEAMSGFTTTGFTLMDVERTPGSLLFLRSLTQWLGGMGFVVITVSLLIVSGRPAIVLLGEKGFQEKLFPRMAHHVQVIALTYVVLTLIGVALLLLSGLKPFEAVCYTLSGISTGGFALHAGSVGELQPTRVSLPLMIIMTLGAVNFILYYRSWRSHRKVSSTILEILKKPQVLSLLFLIALLGFFLSLTIDGEGSWKDAFFLAISAQTGTGYYTLSPTALPAGCLWLLIGAMFIGGSLGSTSGGIKLFRMIGVFKTIKWNLRTHRYPKEFVFRAGKAQEAEELSNIFSVILIYIFFIFLGSLFFIAYGFDPLKSLFEVTSAVCTVGLSAGIVSPELNPGLKVMLILLMWAGRLEFLPILLWGYSIAVRSR